MVGPLLASFFGGLTAFVFARFMFSEEEGEFSAVVSALIAILIIVLLGYYYYSRPKTDLRQAGDNLYYLGLLFTLSSLIFALVQLFLLELDDDELRMRTRELIGNFGIALTSTVAGILGRILLQSMGDEADDTQAGDPSAMLPPDISEPARALRRSLREATDAFSHFTRQTQSHAEQARVHSQTLIREFNAKMSSEAEQGLAEIMESWRLSLQSIARESSQMAQRVNQQAEEATSNTVAAWQELSEEVKSATELSRGQLRGFVRETSALASRLDDVNRALGSLVNGLGAAARDTRSFSGSAAAAAGHFDSTVREISNASKMLSVQADGAKDFLQEGLAEFTESVARLTKTAQDQLQRDGARWLTSVTEITDLVEARLQKATDDAEVVSAVSDDVAREADKALAAFREMTNLHDKQSNRTIVSSAMSRMGAAWKSVKRRLRV